MNETLNFGKAEKAKLKEILGRFEPAMIASDYEEARAKRDGCTVTLYESGKLLIQGANSAAVKAEIISMMGLKKDLVIGIDETGRGEKSGPLVVAGVLADTNSLREIRDSKKTSDIAAKEKIVSRRMLGAVTVSINSELVDLARSSGINLNQIEAKAMDAIAEFLLMFGEARVVADGSPMKTANKKIMFLPKADDIEPVVGAASVVAKRARDVSQDRAERKTWNIKEKNSD